MAFAMRINFVDVVCKDSLRNLYINGNKEGYQFQIRLSYYRGHFLSCIDEFIITVDGEVLNDDDIVFCLNEKEFDLQRLNQFSSEFWNIMDPAVIKVYKKGGISIGEHAIDVHLMLRVPYLPLPGSDSAHSYMPLDSCGTAILNCREE